MKFHVRLRLEVFLAKLTSRFLDFGQITITDHDRLRSNEVFFKWKILKNVQNLLFTFDKLVLKLFKKLEK